jgi:hypothetical protein
MSGFSAHLSLHYHYNIFNKMVIDNTAHPQHLKLCCHLLRKSEQRPLWFSVSTSKASGGKFRVVRSHIQRRIRAAFAQALLKRGCDIHGKRLPHIPVKGRETGDIRGTIYAHSSETALTMRMEDLEAQAEWIVGQLVYKRGNRLTDLMAEADSIATADSIASADYFTAAGDSEQKGNAGRPKGTAQHIHKGRARKGKKPRYN